jgi:hypothetical protein
MNGGVVVGHGGSFLDRCVADHSKLPVVCLARVNTVGASLLAKAIFHSPFALFDTNLQLSRPSDFSSHLSDLTGARFFSLRFDGSFHT